MNTKQLLLLTIMGLAIACAGVSTSVLAEEVSEEQAKAEQLAGLTEEEAVQVLAEEHNEEQENEQSKVVCKKEAQAGSR